MENAQMKPQTSMTVNGIDTEALMQTVNAIQGDPGLGVSRFRATNKWIAGNHNRSTVTGFYAARQEIAHKQPFEMRADEPAILAGNDDAANPVEHLLHALASCVTTSMVAHAAVRDIPINAMACELEGDIDLNGFLGLSADTARGFTDIRMKFKIDADPEHHETLLKLCMFSPVFNTISNGANVDIELEQR